MSLTSLFSSMRSCVHSVSNCKLLRALLLRLGDRDEIGAGPAAVDDFVGDALVGEAEMARRLVERRVDDRVFDDDLAHRATLELQFAGEGGFLSAARKSCASKPRLALAVFGAGLCFSVSFVFVRATVSFPTLATSCVV